MSMVELDLWFKTLDSDVIQELPAAERMALVSVAALVASDETNGFLPATGVRRVPWGEGPTDLREHLARLVEAGLLVESVEPPGWNIPGWTLDSRSGERPPGGSSPIGWGQQTRAKVENMRERSRERSRRHRERTATVTSDGTGDATPKTSRPEDRKT